MRKGSKMPEAKPALDLNECLATPVAWSKTADPLNPFEATVGADSWVVRLNDFPPERLFTLIVNGAPVDDFNNWPDAWSLPDSVELAKG